MFKADEVSNEELASLTDAIKKKYGVDFTNYEPRSLKRGFARLVTKNNMNSRTKLNILYIYTHY